MAKKSYPKTSKGQARRNLWSDGRRRSNKKIW